MAAPKLLKPEDRLFLHDAERDWYDEGKKALRWVKDHGACDDYQGRRLIEGVRG